MAAAPRGGDLLLVFTDGEYGWADPPGGLYTEWADVALKDPLTAAGVPAAGEPVEAPRVSGVLHRTVQYPAAWDAFDAWAEAEKAAGRRSEEFLLPTTQATTIGRETFFIQNDPRELFDAEPGKEPRLLCALNSFAIDPYPSDKSGDPWPLLGVPRTPAERTDRTAAGEWRDTFGPLHLMFGDAGCVYFLLTDAGEVVWAMDCY